MRKLTKGAQMLVAGGTLKEDQVQSLLKANDEAVELARSLFPVVWIQYIEGLLVPGYGSAPVARIW